MPRECFSFTHETRLSSGNVNYFHESSDGNRGDDSLEAFDERVPYDSSGDMTSLLCYSLLDIKMRIRTHTLSCKDLKKNILMRGSLPYFCNSPSSSVLISLFPFHHLLRTGSSSMGTHIRKYRQERVWRRKRLAIHSMRSGLFVTSSRLQEEIKKTRIEQRSCGRRKSRMLRHHHLLSHLNMWFIKNRVTLKMLVVQQTPFLFQQPSSWEDLLNKKDVSRNGFPCDLFRSFSPSFALLSF